MSQWIEEAKSGRAKCRKCNQKIDKGVLRLGIELETQFGTSTYWYHLDCAATTKPVELEDAIGSFSGDIPDKAALLTKASSGKKSVKPTVFPYAEISPSGRSTCIQCDEKIPKEELRVAVEEEIDTGNFTKMGARYMHAKCAKQYIGASDLFETLKKHSTTLEDKDLDELKKLI